MDDLNAFKAVWPTTKMVYLVTALSDKQSQAGETKIASKQPPEEKIMEIRTYILRKKWMQYSTRISG